MSAKQTAAQQQAAAAAALNPEAKSFSPVLTGGTTTSSNNQNNNAPTSSANSNQGAHSTRSNSGPPSAATAPLPAGENIPSSSSSSNNPGNNNQQGGGPGGNYGGGRGGGSYVPPARAQPNVGPPLHHQNQNPNLYSGGGPGGAGGVSGHGASSFYPHHSGGGGGRFNNNNQGGGHNNNFGGGGHHHHNNNQQHGGGNFNNHHHNNNNHHNNQQNFGGGNGPYPGGNNNAHGHHHHQHHQHHHNYNPNHNNNNMPHHHHPHGGSNLYNNNPQGNFPPPHQHHHNQHHHHNNLYNNNNNMMNNNNNNMMNNNQYHNNQQQHGNIPHPRGGGPGSRGARGNNMMHNNNNNNNNQNNNNNSNMMNQGGGGGVGGNLRREARKAVVVLGAPKSGKTTLAKRIAKELNNFHYVEAPLDKEKFETLSDELKKIASEPGHHDKMLVLDGFGADHDADLFYLASVLKRYNFDVYGLIYLNLGKPAQTISDRQEKVPPTTAQMFGHAVAFETCAQYDSSPNLILIDADMTADDVYAKFTEMWVDAQVVPLEVLAPKVLKSIDRSFSWKMENYNEFKNVTQALERALPPCSGNGTTPMPLRSAYGPLTYSHFSRWYSRLPKYQVSLMTCGQRVVLFAYNGYLYFLPEHGYYVFRYDPPNASPTSARVVQWFEEFALRCDKPETTCPLVLDAEYVIFQNDEYILLRDILVFGNERCYNLPLRERIEKMTSCARQRAENDPNPNIQILPHRYCNVDKVADIFSVWERAEETEDASQPITKVGVGVRLEPPGEYVIGQHDPNLLYWFDADRIAIVARLWNVEDDVDGAQKFTVMGVDDTTGFEANLPKDCPAKVLIDGGVIAEEQLGEGHIVELSLRKRLTTATPASRGGRSQNRNQNNTEILEFKFERRRWDIAVPMYHSTISSIIHQVKHSWTREYFRNTCELVKDVPTPASMLNNNSDNIGSANASGSQTPMTPGSPSNM